MVKIGMVAGDILELLEDFEGPLNLKDMEFFIEEEDDVILMSLGWLVREGVVEMRHINEDYIISRRHSKEAISHVA